MHNDHETAALRVRAVRNELTGQWLHVHGTAAADLASANRTHDADPTDANRMAVVQAQDALISVSRRFEECLDRLVRAVQVQASLSR